MSQSAQFLDVAGENGSSRKIAYLQAPVPESDAPGVVWMGGFASDMTGGKATGLANWAAERDVSCLRFDYSGHGQSSGRFQDGTIGEGLADSLAAFTTLTTGPQIVIGSSMGGWLALLLARALQQNAPDHAARIKALVLIAPAWDMTEELIWKHLPSEAREAIERDGVYMAPSEYDAPLPITRALIEEGRTHSFELASFSPGCPVRILQGMQDPDVPWQHAQRLVEQLGETDMRMTLVKDGEHRMSRESDLALLFQTLGEFTGK
ncbi:MAG: alpha/beta hydrolase [Alphaproteobacteria bacterium]